MILMTVTLHWEVITTVYQVRWKMHCGYRRRTPLCAFYRAEWGVHDPLISNIIRIYLCITNNICNNSVKEQGVEVPPRIQKKIIVSLINIMLIYTVLYCSPETWVVILGVHYDLPSHPPHWINASHSNHHVHNFSLMLMQKTLNTAKNKTNK